MPMMQTARNGHAYKLTVAEALPEAMEILQAQRNEDAVAFDDFLAEAKRVGISESAALDTLRFLEGVGTISFNDLGDVVVQA